MRRTVLILGFLVAVALGALWLAGGLDGVGRWAAERQRAVQDGLARGVRALRAGEAGALAGLMAVSFGYGFFHAVGPGHGKMLIGGYGVARRVPMLRLASIALVASLAQAAFAVALVSAGILVFGWTRERMVGVGEEVMAPVSYALIGGVGLWLAWRGGRGLAGQSGRAGPQGAHLGHGHHHPDHAACDHVHGPTLDEVARVAGWRDALALIAGIAIRPCSGALFLLILTWSMGIWAAGVAGTFAMGIGTAVVTIAVAAMAVWAREGALASLPGSGLARAVPALELVAGLAVALVAGSLLAGAF